MCSVGNFSQVHPLSGCRKKHYGITQVTSLPSCTTGWVCLFFQLYKNSTDGATIDLTLSFDLTAI